MSLVYRWGVLSVVSTMLSPGYLQNRQAQSIAQPDMQILKHFVVTGAPLETIPNHYVRVAFSTNRALPLSELVVVWNLQVIFDPPWPLLDDPFPLDTAEYILWHDKGAGHYPGPLFYGIVRVGGNNRVIIARANVFRSH